MRLDRVHIPFRICQTHCHRGFQGHPLPDIAAGHTRAEAASCPGPDFLSPFTPRFLARPSTPHLDTSALLTRRFADGGPTRRKGGKKTAVHNTRQTARWFSELTKKAANRRRALRLQSPQLQVRTSTAARRPIATGLGEPTNHRTEGGAGRRGGRPRLRAPGAGAGVPPLEGVPVLPPQRRTLP